MKILRVHWTRTQARGAVLRLPIDCLQLLYLLVDQLATGVTQVENDNDNNMCLNSTLTFTGTVADLEQLNGAVLTCDDGAGLTDNVTIVIPSESNYTLCVV